MVSSPGFPQGVRIVRQELQSEPPVGVPGLERLLLTRPGDALDEALVQRSLRRLLATDLFATVEVDRMPVPGGLELIYRAQARRRIRAVYFSGSHTFLDRQLRDVISLKVGGDLREGGAETSREELSNFYRERGYLEAKVVPAIDVDPRSGEWIVKFTVEEGPRFTIRSVDLEGIDEAVEAPLRSLLGSREGAPFDGRTFQADLQKLEDYYLSNGFYGVTVTGVEGRNPGATVDLRIQVREGIRTELRWEGIEAFSPTVLEPVLTFRQERTVDEFELEASRSALEAYYRERGFPYAVIQAHLEKADRGRVVTFSVEEGAHYRVGAASLEGNRAFSSSDLLALIKSQPGQPYAEADVAADVRRLAGFYRAEGFLSAEVNVAQRAFDSARGRVDLALAIREGIRTTVREVEILGAHVLSPSTLLPTLRLRPGAPLREEGMEADRLAILERYGNEGYIYAVVTTSLDFSVDRSSARVVHTVEEKHQARLRSLFIIGNQRTRSRVLRREIPLTPGDPYRYKMVLEGEQRIYQLGIVRSVRLIPLEPELEPREVDLLLRVEEQDAGRFAFGAGYSSEERLRGFVEVGHRNLWGAARSASARLRLSEISYRAELTYVEPWVLRRRVDGEVNLFTDFREERGYNIRRSGLILGLRREYTESLRAALRYRLEDVRLSQVTDPAAVLDDPGGHTTSSLSLNPTLDTRNDLLDPSRGQVSGITLTVAGGLLGGTDEFVKAEVQTSWFISLRWMGILALSLRSGVAAPFGDSDRVPIHERFFAGGSYSVRGFGDRRLGPKDPGGTPRGGEAVLTVSGELRVPVYQWLGATVFVDSGQVWQRRSDVALRASDDLQWAVGAGLRLRTPLGPVRLDFGYRLQEERGEDRWRVHFTLGHAF